LDLGGTKITDTGLKEVVGLHKLRKLRVSCTEITDAGLKELANLHNLREIVVVGTKVTPAGVQELNKALPNCEVVR
jgi:internalin A